MLGTGYGVISFGGCFLVDHNVFVVVVDSLWLWPKTLVNDWLSSRKLTLAKMKFPELMAFTDFDTTGLKHAACIYDTNSFLFLAKRALLEA